MNKRKKSIMNDSMVPEITVAELMEILFLGEDETITFYDEDYEILETNAEGITVLKGYYPGLFTLSKGDIRVQDYLVSKYALAKVTILDHCKDGKFRAMIKPYSEKD